MGPSGIGWGELLIVLAIVVLVFGTGKLGRIGGDLGAAIRNFRSAMSDVDGKSPAGSPDDKGRADVPAHASAPTHRDSHKGDAAERVT